MIESAFKEHLNQFQVDSKIKESLWVEIKSNYSESNRYYHNLEHLEDIYRHLLEVKAKLENWNIVLFTLFYHDLIYKSTKKNNEEASAQLAKKRMKEIGISQKEIELCSNQILATKGHAKSMDSDTNYFTDADLSILGRDSKTYIDYCKKIRKEYSIYPKFMYNKGRRNIIKHFISMKRIYKTEEFYNRYETQAKLNLETELTTL